MKESQHPTPLLQLYRQKVKVPQDTRTQTHTHTQPSLYNLKMKRGIFLHMIGKASQLNSRGNLHKTIPSPSTALVTGGSGSIVLLVRGTPRPDRQQPVAACVFPGFTEDNPHVFLHYAAWSNSKGWFDAEAK